MTMQNREEIFQLLTTLMAEMFDISADRVELSSSLSGDLDIDSIDAVDLMVKLREITGKRIQPEDFKSVRTIQDVVDTIHNLYTR